MKKDKVIIIRVSSQDKDAIRERAKAAGYDLSNYLRSCALGTVSGVCDIDSPVEFMALLIGRRMSRDSGTHLDIPVFIKKGGFVESYKVTGEYVGKELTK